MHNKLAAVGDKDSVLGFQAIGMDVFPVADQEETARTIFRLAKAGYAVIFITEQAAEDAADMIDRYASQAYPAIIPIPSGRGGTGLGMRRLKENVEKAIGADILFGKEG